MAYHPKTSFKQSLRQILTDEELVGNLEITHGEVVDGDLDAVVESIQALFLSLPSMQMEEPQYRLDTARVRNALREQLKRELQ